MSIVIVGSWIWSNDIIFPSPYFPLPPPHSFTFFFVLPFCTFSPFTPSFPFPSLPLPALLLFHPRAILPPDLPFEVAAAPPPATPFLIGGAKNLWGRENLFSPLLRKFSFLQINVFPMQTDISSLTWGVREVLYVIASHPPPISLFNLLSTADSRETHVLHNIQHHNPTPGKAPEGPVYCRTLFLTLF